ncbi:MAG: glycerol acyltransferase [Chloroflexi bacterium]|nr:glycerol acyltransferase [Chloroflexota bacterium]
MNGADARERLDRLTQINRDDLMKSFKLNRVPLLSPLLKPALWASARQFSRIILEYDQTVRERGFQAAAQFILDWATSSVTVHGADHIPSSGPALIVSNHPGLSDTVALFAQIERTDLRTIAAKRPFLDALAHVHPYLIVLDEDDERSGVTVLKQATAYLRSGGLVVTFPNGRIEPDPLTMSGAIEALSGWSESLALFVRRVPDLLVVPAMVGGVISARALQHPVTWLYRDPKQRDWAAATIQFSSERLRRVPVVVAFSQALPASQLASLSREELIATITGQVAGLMRQYAQARP